MYNQTYYQSPLGRLLLVSYEDCLVGLWIEGQKYYMGKIKERPVSKETVILRETKKWLDEYFDGWNPSISRLKIAPEGTEFQKRVWRILCDIPYGQTTTYKAIAQTIAKQMNKSSMSTQAVGSAVGHNPISIIIPCHRVVGTNGSLTGYAGGLERKRMLLALENINLDSMK